MGHGRLSPDLWVSPRQPGEGLGALLAQHGQDDAHRVTTEPGDTDRDRRIVDDAWDLAELHAAQEAFSRRWSAAPPTTEPEAAFRERIELVHHWRSFLRLDPGLPEPLLPPDPRGRAALALFRARYEALEAPGWRFVAAVSARSPDGPALVPQQPPSPFALGVDLEAGASA
jgi:phenylacetic acid degradation operon negative regulatory protein